MTTVSVILPFIDGSAAFLAEAVESVLAQSHPAVELLLVNDGASGPCRALAEDYQARYPGIIRVLAFEGGVNRGVSAARNLGLRHASGGVVALLDADDVWLPGKLRDQLTLLESNPEVGMLYGNTLYWYSWSGHVDDATRDFVPRLGLAADRAVDPPGPLPGFLSGRFAVPCTCSVLLRREVLERVGGFEESFPDRYDDQVIWAKISLVAPVYVAGGCWDRYRQHPGSMTGGKDTEEIEARARQVYLEWLEKYLQDQGVSDPRVWKALTGEQRLLRLPPRARRRLRQLRKAWWRASGLLR